MTRARALRSYYYRNRRWSVASILSVTSVTLAANGETLTVILNKAVNNYTGFTITPSGSAATLSYSSGDGTNTLVFTTSRTMYSNEIITMNYTPGNVEDLQGNLLDTVSGVVVTNNSEHAPLTLQSATIESDGTTFTLVFSKAVQSTSSLWPGYTHNASGGGDTITYNSGAGSATVTFTGSRTVETGETGTVDYNETDTYAVSGGQLLPNSSVNFVNNSSQDNTAPTLQSAEIPSAGTTIVLTFDEAVVSGVSGGFGLFLDDEVTMTYSEGDYSNQLIYTLSRTVSSTETGVLYYTNPGYGVSDIPGNEWTYPSGYNVTNNSTQP